MNGKFLTCYLNLCGSILFLVGIAKVVASFGDAKILAFQDPILNIPEGQLVIMVGFIEIFISCVCFSNASSFIKLVAIALLSTCFLIYRIGLGIVHYQKPCSCLGGITDLLHIPQNIADLLMKFILFFLLTGSYIFILAYKKTSINCEK